MSENSTHLDANGWQRLVLDKHAEDLSGMVASITNGRPGPLAEQLLGQTQVGWRVLETGAGWGSISATLAVQGRQVALLDWSPEIVQQGISLLDACGVAGHGVCADLFAPLPFADNSFDCVWSSGVLEHFSRDEQVRILKESMRVAKSRVISLVPNAYSLAYRIGKWYMERTDQWEFGYEQPIESQSDLFSEAGLVPILETTIDAARATWFLERLPGSRLLKALWRKAIAADVHFLEATAHQGYMLLTIGTKLAESDSGGS